MICLSMSYVFENDNMVLYYTGDTGAVTTASPESSFCILVTKWQHMEGYKLTGRRGFDFLTCDAVCSTEGERVAICSCDWYISAPSPVCLRLMWEVPCCFCDCEGIITRVCISSPNVVSGGAAATFSVYSLKIARTINSAIVYIISLSWNSLAGSPHPGWVKLSTLICFCWKLSMHYGNILGIMPIT